MAGVAAFEQRVHIRCAQAFGGGSIFYFAVPSSNRNLASHFLATALVAHATGTQVVVFFSLADTSGASVGCSSGDCRLATGVEMQAGTPIASNGTLAAVAMTVPEPAGTAAELAVIALLALQRLYAPDRRSRNPTSLRTP